MGSDFCLVFVILLCNHMNSHGNNVKRDALKASSHFFQESKRQKEKKKTTKTTKTVFTSHCSDHTVDINEPCSVVFFTPFANVGESMVLPNLSFSEAEHQLVRTVLLRCFF